MLHVLQHAVECDTRVRRRRRRQAAVGGEPKDSVGLVGGLVGGLVAKEGSGAVRSDPMPSTVRNDSRVGAAVLASLASNRTSNRTSKTNVNDNDNNKRQQ